MHYAELERAWQELTSPGARFEIAEIALRGQRTRTYRNAQNSVREFWLSTAAFRDREYLVYQDERITYGEANSQVAAIAAWLFAHGVKPGDMVGIAMRNYPEWMLIYWACLAVGVAAVGMNAWWVPQRSPMCCEMPRPRWYSATRSGSIAFSSCRKTKWNAASSA